MQKIKPYVVALILMLFIGGAAGCNGNIRSLLQKTNGTEQPLLKVQIQFTNQAQTICYVKSLGLEKGAQVYTGGPSSNNMYDRDGNIVGSFNYQQVLFMKVLAEDGVTD